MLYVGLSILASLVSCDHVRDLYLADLHTETCDSNAFNCFAEGVRAGEFCTNDIRFVGVTHDAVDNSCCYTYRSVYVGAVDCEGKKTSQSHWTLSAQCPVGPTVITTGLSKHVDASLCLDGIKFDSECDDPNGCEYSICMQFPGQQCCTDMGWVAVKSGNTYCIDEVEVPSCRCETPNPTDDPTFLPTSFPSTDPTAFPSTSPSDSPSKAPSNSPSETPTNFPSVDPTKAPSPAPSTSPTNDPTIEPTPFPSADPTENPTPAPTAFCEPVVEIHVNAGCTADNFEAWDTNIVYALIQQYASLDEFEGGVTDTPQDALSQIVVGHACQTDVENVETDAQPLSVEPAAINDASGNVENSDLPGSESADAQPATFKFHMPSVDFSYDSNSLLFVGLIVYSVLATSVAVYCWCRARRQRRRMESYQIESDVDVEVVDEEQLPQQRDKKFML